MKKNVSLTVTAAVITVLVAALGQWLFRYRYDIIDDVLMRDILSGAYLGVTEARNAQNLYPLGLFLGLLYRLPVVGSFDWYGAFLVICQFTAFFLVISFLFREVSCRSGQNCTVPVILTAFALLSPVLAHLVLVQYSFAAAMLAGASSLIICVSKKHGFLPVILVWIAFAVRSEMTALLLPLLGVSVLFAAVSGMNRQEGGKESVRTLIKSVIIMTAGILVLYGWNRAAYSAGGWAEFEDFFEARTELYDFQFIPDYGENRQFYEETGLSEESAYLLENYNFGLDEEIDPEVIRKTASYAESLREKESIPEKVKKVLPDYLYRLRNIRPQTDYQNPSSDAPWNGIVFILYVCVIVAGWRAWGERTASPGSRRNVPVIKRMLMTVSFPVILFAVRSALWMFLLVRGRAPVRVTHGLYFTETAALAGMAVSLYMKGSRDLRRNGKTRAVTAAAFVCMVCAAAYLPAQAKVLSQECTARDSFQEGYERLYEYFEQHPDNFYLMDVYTAVSYDHTQSVTSSAVMFENRAPGAYNHDLCGGWYCKSPAQRQKLSDAGLSSDMSEALLSDKAFFVTAAGDDVTWLERLYEDKGTEADIAPEDTVAGLFDVYAVSRSR